MCLPGFDDREEVPWTSHKKEGYSYDEMTQAVREASKALRAASTHEKPELTGMFFDFGTFAGTQWASRLEEEAKDANASADLVKPDRVVFFDVILGPSPNAEDIPTDIETPTTKELVSGNLYNFVFALGFLTQRYIAKLLAPFVVFPPLILLTILGLTPLHEFDPIATDPLYGDKKPGLFRLFYLTYPYWNYIKVCWAEKSWAGPKKTITLHQDWKATPILYLYGKKKKCYFHNFATLAMLEREEAEKRSLSKVVGVEEAGHFLFVTKHDECLKHVLDFVKAENTFVSS